MSVCSSIAAGILNRQRLIADHAPCVICGKPVLPRKKEVNHAYGERRACSDACSRKCMAQSASKANRTRREKAKAKAAEESEPYMIMPVVRDRTTNY